MKIGRLEIGLDITRHRSYKQKMADNMNVTNYDVQAIEGTTRALRTRVDKLDIETHTFHGRFGELEKAFDMLEVMLKKKIESNDKLLWDNVHTLQAQMLKLQEAQATIVKVLDSITKK